MLHRRKCCIRASLHVAATLLLIFGHSDCIFAQVKADMQLPPSTISPPLKASAENNMEVNATKMVRNESQAEAAATTTTTTEKSQIHTEISGKGESNETHAEAGSSETSMHTDGPKIGNSETAKVSNSATSNSTNQTGGTTAKDPPPPVLSIFLVNDLLYDIFPVDPNNGSICYNDPETNKCIGGLPLLKTLMDDIRRNNTQSVWLDAGNTLGGDMFRRLKFDAAVQAMKFLNFNATAVGPNVFMYGGDAGRTYLDGLNDTVVVSNVQPTTQRKSVTLSVGNCSVSVIGYVEKTGLNQDIQGVSVKNDTQSVLEEINNIKNKSNITIVIGSSSVKKSQALATNENIDVVLFSEANWSADAERVKEKLNVPNFFWKTVDKKPLNKTAYVGSLNVNHSDVAGRFIVGQIDLTLQSCRIANASVKVLNYTNTNYSEEALNFIKGQLGRLQNQNESLTQNTKNMTEERALCCHSECSLGNLITDAMVAAINGDSNWSCNTTRIGLYPAVDLAPNMTVSKGSVSVMDLFGLIDEDAYIYSVLLTGRQLKSLLEVSINSSNYPNSTDFLHISSLLQIDYRKNHENRSELVSVKTVSAALSSMRLSEIDVKNDTVFYNISVPLTLLKIDSYKKLLSAVNASFHNVTIVDAVTKYIINKGSLPLPALGSRFIELEAQPVPPPPPIPCAYHTGTTVAVTLVVAALIVGIVFGIWRWRSIRSHLLPGYVNF